MLNDGSRELLGKFLRSRRAQITLEQAGLPPRRGSRTGTLTQEDLARLTGYSVRTISALEQGTEHRPTPDLLDAITAALALGPEERHTLWYLAAEGPPPPSSAGAADHGPDPGLRRLLRVLEPHIAYVTDEARDVQAVTRGCVSWLGRDMSQWQATRRNITHWVFLEPHARHVYPYWEAEPAWSTIAHLRSQFARLPNSPRLREVTEEIRDLSPDAKRIWEAQERLVFHPPTTVTMRVPGHTDPDQPDDERYHVTVTVSMLAPTRAGDQHLITAFMLPDEYAREYERSSAQTCTACTAGKAGKAGN